MKIQKKKGIYWGELAGSTSTSTKHEGSYLFASSISYHSPSYISFENKLMPSGQIIHEWSSAWNYQGYRVQPALPLLKRGHRYRLSREMNSYPEASVFLKIIFYDRYDQEVGDLIEREESLDFLYPLDAYSYKVQLLSAGVESLEFHYLSLAEITEELHDSN